MAYSFFISASLYPSNMFPQRGLFVEKRLLALRDHYKDNAEFHIYAPTPIFLLRMLHLEPMDNMHKYQNMTKGMV